MPDNANVYLVVVPVADGMEGEPEAQRERWLQGERANIERHLRLNINPNTEVRFVGSTFDAGVAMNESFQAQAAADERALFPIHKLNGGNGHADG